MSLNKYGYKVLKTPKILASLISKGISKSIIYKFPKKNFKNLNEQFKFISNLSDREFKDKFGNNAYRILDSLTTNKINKWINSKIKDELKCKRISLNVVSKYDLKNNSSLKKKQFNAFFRIVRNNKNDVGFPHRDSAFWKLGKLYAREAPFKYKYRWKFWIPIYGVNKKNCLRIIKKSHKDDIKIIFKKVKNSIKPSIPKFYMKKNYRNIIVPLRKFNGNEGILFHDDTIHFGPKNYSTNCRVSAEFNILTS
jgi:hypothetical protein